MSPAAQHSLKFFITKTSCLQAMELYIHVDIARLTFHINAKTIKNGLCNNRNGRTNAWSHFKYADGTYLNYDLIPKTSKVRNSLPLAAKDAYNLLKQDVKVKEDIFRHVGDEILYSNMLTTYCDRWPCYVKYYKELLRDKIQIQRYAQMHSLFEFIIDQEQKGRVLKNSFESFKRIILQEIDGKYKPVFSTLNYYAFLRKIREAKRIGIPQTLIHKAKGRRRSDLAVLNGEDRNYIMSLKCSNKNYTSRNIQELLVEERGVFVSRETIKKVGNDTLTRNVTKDFSIGNSYTKKNRRPTLKRSFSFPGDEYQADGSKLQFVCVDHIGKIVKLVFYVVLDAYSRKVVGFSVDRSENAQMVRNAFKMSFLTERFLPAKIVVDNGPSYRDKDFQKFIKTLQHYGVEWRFCHKDYPQEKAEVESFFSVFQKVICTKYPFYIGEGIKSKNRYGNPATDLNKDYQKKKRQLPLENDLKISLFNYIKKYNEEYYRKDINAFTAVSQSSKEELHSNTTSNDFAAVLA